MAASMHNVYLCACIHLRRRAIGSQQTWWEKKDMFLQLSFTYLNSKYHTLEPSKPVNNPLFNFRYPQSIKTKQFLCLILPALKWIPHTALRAGAAFTFMWWSEHTDGLFHDIFPDSYYETHSALYVLSYGALLKCTAAPSQAPLAAAHSLYVTLLLCMTKMKVYLCCTSYIFYVDWFMRICCPCTMCTNHSSAISHVHLI